MKHPIRSASAAPCAPVPASVRAAASAQANPSAQHSITLGNRTIVYTWSRKPVKNINLRIRRDGSVAVSSPRAVPQETIEKFLQSRQRWILQALERTETHRLPPQELPPDSGTRIFGQAVQVRFVPEGTAVGVGELALPLPVPDTPETREQALNAHLQALCRETVQSLCRACYPQFAQLGISFPVIRFRTMKSRWGSCHPAKGILTFNDALVHVPLPCVEYVVLHEWVHFLHPNHSPAFYRCLAQFLPDWKARRAQLNGR